MMISDGSIQMPDGPPKARTQGEGRSIRFADIPDSGAQQGTDTGLLDANHAESDVDPLDALLVELERIQGHESTLREAVANNKPVVVHPRPEALAPPRAPGTPATPQDFVVEGGLASFEVAQDLLHLDFNQPEQAPEEFRGLSFDPQRITTHGSGVSGSFGELDPASAALQDYLTRIQQQAHQVRTLIETQRQLHPIPRKALMPGASGNSEDLHAEQIQAGQVPTSRYLGTYSTLAPSEPPAKPRVSEGAVSIEAKHGKSLDGRALPGHMSNLSQDGGLQNSTAILHVTIIANSSIPEKGEEQKSSAETHSMSIGRKENKIVRPHFYGRTAPRTQAAAQQPIETDGWAMLRLVLFIISFVFYLFTRSTTMDAKGSTPLYLYQLAVIFAEGLVFLSGCLTGIWQVHIVAKIKQQSQMSSDPQSTEPSGTKDLAKSDPAAASSPFRIQVIIDGVDRHLNRLLKTVAAVQDMKVPQGCSKQIHIIHNGRHQDEAEWSQLISLEGFTLHVASAPGDPSRPGALALGDKAGYTNAVLHLLYPRGNDIAATDVVAFFQAGQVGNDAYLQQALYGLEQPGMRMVYSQLAASSESCFADIYNQDERFWQHTVAPHAPAWQCTAVPGNSAFLVHTRSLHDMGWFPHQSRAGASALAEGLARDNCPAVPSQPQVGGCSPNTLPETYQAAFEVAQGRFQQAFCPLGARIQWNSSLRPFLQHTLAWCTFVSAVTTLFFDLIPLIRIRYGIFPFIPNRWFGIGFLVYYCCCSPFLYQVSTWQRAVMLWDWYVASKLLWWQHLMALRSMLCHVLIGRWCRLFCQRRRKPRQDTEAGSTTGKVAEASDAGAKRPRGRPCTTQSIIALLARDVPWRAVVSCVLPLLGACLGTWLLFQDFQTALGARRRITTLSLFAANLTLIMSILWCLSNALVYALPCHYAALLCCLDQREDSRILAKRQRGLAIQSMVSLVVVVCCMLLTVLACTGLGEGAYNLKGASQTQDYDYSDALGASMQFYAAQRSGMLGPNYPVSWRGNSGLNDTPAGGYYLGTNNLKLTFPIAAATFQMAWGIASLPGSGVGVDQQVLTEMRWATDYLLACYDNSTLVTQVGNMDQELHVWDRPEDVNYTRPIFVVSAAAPGADVMAHTAAALGAASAVFSKEDPVYAALLLIAAESLYSLAAANEGLYSDNFVPNAKLYASTSYLDDLMLASAWLAKVSGQPAYLAAAETYWDRISTGNNTSWQSVVPNWDNQWWASNVVLTGLTGNPRYQNENAVTRCQSRVRAWNFKDGGTLMALDAHCTTRAQMQALFTAWTQGTSSVSHTPQGLALAGSEGYLRNAANAALLALVHARQISGFGSVRLACWARDQMRYILGAGGRSYIVGWGMNPPTHIPSPAASCPSAVVQCTAVKASSQQYASQDPNPHTITGALVSGPGSGDVFSDVRSAADTAISVEYNGGLSGALAMLSAKEWELTCGSRRGLIR